MMIQAGINVGFSELLIIFDSISTHKISYDRDNRVISPYRPYRRGGLLPRCWIGVSWRVKKLPRVGLFVH